MLLALGPGDKVTIEQLHQVAAWFFWSGGVVMSAGAAIVTLLGLLSLAQVIAPGLTAMCGEALRERNPLSALTGALIVGGFFPLAALIGRSAGVVSLAIVAVLTVLAFFGLAAAAEDVGRRLSLLANRERDSRFRHLVVGWLVLGAASCVPIVGWFIVLPYAILSGLGSIGVGTFLRFKAAATARGIE